MSCRLYYSSMMLLMRSRKERERRRQILLEGQRLIQDALDAGVKPQSIFFSRKESLEALKIPYNTSADIFKLQYKQLQLWSNLTTSPGIVGTVIKCLIEAQVTVLTLDISVQRCV